MQEKIQNIHQKFNAPQNEIRLAIMNFIVDNHRPFSLKEDGYTALKGITLSSAEDFFLDYRSSLRKRRHGDR